MRSKKALLNLIFNVILKIIIIIYGFVVPKIIISHFGSEINGLVSSITQFLAYITLLESGFGPVVKAALYKPIAQKNRNEILGLLKSAESVFKKISKVFIVYIMILSVIYPLFIKNDFGFIFTFSLIIIISISVFAEYYFGMTYRLYLQAEQKNYIISIIQIVSYVICIFLVVICAKIGTSVQTIKLVTSLAFVLRPILQNFYVRKNYHINLKNETKKIEIKNKWDGLAQHIAAVIHGNTDISILTIFSTLNNVSIYSVYALITSGVRSFLLSFVNGFDSTFGDMIAKNEVENLNKKYGIYETLYQLIVTILFSSAIILISPFVSIYTNGIKDLNYVNLTFGYLIAISEFIWAIRQPYNELVKSAGHFKETRIGAWVECISNIVISIILVRRYGLIGVAIGTIVAMTIRTVEFVYHTNKYILNRTIWESGKKILLVIIETLIIVFISKYLPYLENISYFNWIVNAIMVVVLASAITIALHFIFFRKEFKGIFKIIKGIFKKQKKIN